MKLIGIIFFLVLGLGNGLKFKGIEDVPSDAPNLLESIIQNEHKRFEEARRVSDMDEDHQTYESYQLLQQDPSETSMENSSIGELLEDGCLASVFGPQFGSNKFARRGACPDSSSANDSVIKLCKCAGDVSPQIFDGATYKATITEECRALIQDFATLAATMGGGGNGCNANFPALMDSAFKLANFQYLVDDVNYANYFAPHASLEAAVARRSTGKAGGEHCNPESEDFVPNSPDCHGGKDWTLEDTGPVPEAVEMKNEMCNMAELQAVESADVQGYWKSTAGPAVAKFFIRFSMPDDSKGEGKMARDKLFCSGGNGAYEWCESLNKYSEAGDGSCGTSALCGCMQFDEHEDKCNDDSSKKGLVTDCIYTCASCWSAQELRNFGGFDMCVDGAISSDSVACLFLTGIFAGDIPITQSQKSNVVDIVTQIKSSPVGPALTKSAPIYFVSALAGPRVARGLIRNSRGREVQGFGR